MLSAVTVESAPSIGPGSPGGTAPVTVEVIEDESALDMLEREWDDLVSRCAAPLLFQTHQWVTCWWRHFGRPRGVRDQARLFVLVVRENGRLTAAAPFYTELVEIAGVRARTLRFLGHEASDYGDLLVSGDRAASIRKIVERLSESPAAFDLLDLREWYGSSENFPVFRACLAQAGFVWRLDPDSTCRFIPVTTTWEEYYRRCFDGRRRKDHRREWRNLRAFADADMRILRSFREKPDLLDRLAEIQREHPDAGPDRPGIFNVEEYRSFFADLLPRIQARGWLHVALLEVGGKLSAYWLGFVLEGRHYLYSTAYRRDLRKLGIGKLSMMGMLEQAWSSGTREIDFLRGAEAYKTEWAIESRYNARLLAVRGTTGARLRLQLWTRVFPALSEQRPALYRALCLVRSDGWRGLARKMGQRVTRRPAAGRVEDRAHD